MQSFEKLSARKVANIKRSGRYGDGGGLWLQVAQTGTKSWLLRYMLDGKARAMGLGPLHAISLAEARDRARQARQLLADGIDPIADKHEKRAAARLDASREVSFKRCAEQYMAAHEAAWKNRVHRRQWRNSLTSYAYPFLGGLPVASIDTSLILRTLEPLWTTKTETAVRLRLRVEKVLDWAKARGFRQGENPARWRGHLDHLLAAPKKLKKARHHPALPYDQMPAFMGELRERKGLTVNALEILALTATRSNEVMGARWSEIDLKAKVWTVPAERMKSGRQHRIPLSSRALEIFKALPRQDGNDFVFGVGRPMHPLRMWETFRAMRKDFVPHGLRATFRSWAAEQTNYAREICEAALSHAIGDAVELAYMRSDLFEKRRRLMEDWSRFCARPSAPAGVTDLAQARRRRG